MEQQALGLLPVLKDSHVPVDVKVDLGEKLKTHIKHHSVPDEAVAPTFDVIRTTLTFSQLREIGLSILCHLAKRMLLQQQHELLGFHGSQLLPVLVDRLGDSNSRVQLRAVQGVSELWGACPLEVEAFIHDEVLSSVRANTRRGGMQWILRVYKDNRKSEASFKFKSYVPLLVQGLKDKDASVRETAASVLIDLFSEASEPAKADLQRQLTKSGADSAISENILGSLGLRSSRPSSSDSRYQPEKQPTSSHQQQSMFSHHSAGVRDTGASSKSKKGMAVPPGIDSADAYAPAVAASTKAELDPAKPIEIGSNGQFTLSRHLAPDSKDNLLKLDDLSRVFQPAFEGRESEQNWPLRDKHVLTLRKLNHGNAPKEFTAAFLAQIKILREGILKAVNSLRTTPSTNACYLVQELARTLGNGMDPMVESFMETLLKLAGHTKAISAQNANVTITTLFNHVSYTKSLLVHVQSATTDKNKSPRSFAQSWLKTLIGRHVNHKHVLEHGNGAELMEKIIRKGLADPDPNVRESARDTYWAFNSLWPARGEATMASLGAAAQGQLLSHPSNPDKSKAATQITTSKPAFSKSTNATTGVRPSIKEAMLAKKRERERLERPASAAATTSPVRNPPPRPQSSLAMGTLSSAPIRPVRPKSAKKPEPPKPDGPKVSVKSAARKPIPHSPTKASSPTKADEDLTMIMPALTLGAPAEITSRPKTADSGSPASASINTRTLDTPDLELPHRSLFEGAKVGRGVLDSTPEKAEDDADLETKEVSEVSDSTPVAPGAAGLNEPVANSEQTGDFNETPRTTSESLNNTNSAPQETHDNHDSTPVVIRDEEQHHTSPVLHGRTADAHAANGHASLPNQKVDRSTEVTSTAGFGEGPLKELSESQTNNNNDSSNASTMRLIDSGIKRVSSKTLDAHGFRKLQSTVNNNMDLLSPDKLEQLVRAVIPQIGDEVAPSDDRILTQQLILLKTLSKQKKVPFAGFLPDIICNVLTAMGHYDEQSHTQVTLENSFDDFANLADFPLQQTVDSTLKLVSSKQSSQDAQSLRTLGHAIDGVAKLLRSQKQHGSLQPAAVESVLGVAMTGIKNMDASIRKKSYGLAAEVYTSAEDQEKFWADVDELSASDKAMLHYIVQN